VKKNS